LAVVTLDALNAAGEIEFIAALGAVFEHSPWVAAETWRGRPFATVAALHAAMLAVVRARSEAEQVAFLQAHPELAGQAAQAGRLTEDSAGEQVGAGLDRLSEADDARFRQANERYRARFGFPFILCVRRHTRASILSNFERRLDHDRAAELAAALAEVGHITRLRLAERVVGPGAPVVNGRLSTHVLDTVSGVAAAGVALSLSELDDAGAARLIARAVTNADGRTDSALIGGRPVPIGLYQLEFAMGDYFRRKGYALAEPAFLDTVPIRFAVAEPEAHYHVPLLATPWSYTTYRGS